MKTQNDSPQPHVLVLGGGFVGGLLARACAARGWRITVTHRPGSEAAPEAQSEIRRALFLADDVQTWKNLPEDATHAVWTFPADLAHASFAPSLLEKIPIAVYSSTSCYVAAGPGGMVDENAPRDSTSARFTREEALRADGATLLVLSGLFGPGRDPAGWLARGRIRNADALVNLVHRVDVVRATLAWIENPVAGERFNLSTQCHRWGDLAASFAAAGRVDASCIPAALGLPSESKRVVAQKILARYPRLSQTAFLDARDAASFQIEDPGALAFT